MPALVGDVHTLKKSASFLRDKLHICPELGLVLGSGFGPLVERLEEREEIPYTDIPGFLPATVAGHAGSAIAGRWSGKPILVLSGRAHYYEGHSLQQVTFPVRVLKELGVRAIVLTAAVGSLRREFKPGSLIAISDHINCIADNPLRGPLYPGDLERFPDLCNAYTPELLRLASRTARRLKVNLKTGVYVACTGPSYETPAEVKAFRRLGGDVVGMSLAPEVIVAKNIGLKVLAVACVSNYAAGVAKAPLTHEEVLMKIQESLAGMEKLLTQLLPLLGTR